MKRNTPLHRCVTKLVAPMAIGLGALSVGCQSTQTGPPAAQLSNPMAPQQSFSAFGAPGGPAVNPAASPVNASAAATSTAANPAVAQVGFFNRLHGQSSCNACTTGACQSCAPEMVMAPRYGVDPQEWLCNGGDQNPTAVLLNGDRVAGTEPQDAVVHYTTEAGDIKFAASNPVCVYSPRFGSVRQVHGAVAGEAAIGLGNTYRPVGPGGIGLSQPSLAINEVNKLAHANVAKRVDSMRDRNRGVPVANIVGPVFFEDVWAILATLDRQSLVQLDESQIAILQRGAVAAQSWMIRDAVEVMIESMKPPTLIRDAAVEGFVEYDFPDAGRLQIVKVADRDAAALGDTVTFAIHLRNVGDSPVDHVEIVDSLVTRLEFVADSQKSDHPAKFTKATNEAGSEILTWTLNDPLKVGETVMIEFSCKVR
ncbi:DUF11 domain-containing protein [Stieleria sp. JC731]|uniref:DUF11 domain-containing protein n=1 Tax=Pirellulaceae TaxID=2691357 RepID=UPI001E3E1A84|nr:DUF11 domain-containing protein [Stieleria sp. JC731]MCC9603930.1 DUF11 domain-containing protein [Stieleria sp. JC731]